MGVLVLGMHRSGTSALTRVLNLLGLDAGRDVLMGASESNPTGHWEVERLTSFNDRLLDELGGRWNAPPPDRPRGPGRPGRRPVGRRGRRAPRRGLRRRRPGSGRTPGSACCCRSGARCWPGTARRRPTRSWPCGTPGRWPASLNARDGMALAYGLALWERYTRTLLGRPRRPPGLLRPLRAPAGRARGRGPRAGRLLRGRAPERRARPAGCRGRPPRRRAPPPAGRGSRGPRAGSQAELDEDVLDLVRRSHDPYERGDLPPGDAQPPAGLRRGPSRLSAFVEEADRLQREGRRPRGRAGAPGHRAARRDRRPLGRGLATWPSRSSPSGPRPTTTSASSPSSGRKLPIQAYTRAKGLIGRAAGLRAGRPGGCPRPGCRRPGRRRPRRR